jgi:hypothetical protein
MSLDPKVIGPKFISWLEGETGDNNIELTTQLADLGYDGYSLYSLGQQIDETSWLHGVNITPTQIEGCKTVDDVVKVICA